MTEEYSEGGPRLSEAESSNSPKAPKPPGKRYAQKTALKYGDTGTAFSMGDVKASDLDEAGYFKKKSKTGGKRRAYK